MSWGAVLGAASGTALGDAIDGLEAGLGALIGAALCAPAEAITSIRRGAAEVKPLWYRVLRSALLMALFGWVLGLIHDEPLFLALISGALLGLLGLLPATCRASYANRSSTDAAIRRGGPGAAVNGPRRGSSGRWVTSHTACTAGVRNRDAFP
jgi:hypothetical protein